MVLGAFIIVRTIGWPIVAQQLRPLCFQVIVCQRTTVTCTIRHKHCTHPEDPEEYTTSCLTRFYSIYICFMHRVDTPAIPDQPSDNTMGGVLLLSKIITMNETDIEADISFWYHGWYNNYCKEQPHTSISSINHVPRPSSITPSLDAE